MKKLLIKAFALIGFMLIGGGNSAWAANEPNTIILTQDFQNEATVTNNWTSGNGMALARTLKGNAGTDYYYALSFGNSGNAASWAEYTLPNYSSDNDYKLSFLAGMYSCSSTSRNSLFKIVGTSGDIATTGYVAGSSASVTVTTGSTATPLNINQYSTGNRGNAYRTTTFYNFIVEGNSEDGIFLTILSIDGETTHLAKTRIGDYQQVSKLRFESGQFFGQCGVDNIELSVYRADESCEAPTYLITAPSGTSRKFQLFCDTYESTIYYSTTEKTTSDDGWAPYSGEVTTDATTIWAYAKKGTASSNVISFETGAGNAITLNKPVINLTSFVNNEEIYNPSYTFSVNNSDLLGNPSATISYSLGGAPINANNATITTPCTLTVTVSADGYTSNSTELIIPCTEYNKTFSYNFSTFTEHSETKVGNTQTINNVGCQAYALASDAVDGLTINMNLMWKITANQAYGLIARTGSGSVTYNGPFPPDSKILYYDFFSNPSSSNSATVNFAMYGQMGAMDVYIPVGSTVTKTIGKTGFGTFSAEYNVAVPDGVTVYTSSFSDNTITANADEEIKVIPANIGVIFKGEAEASITFVKTAEAGSAITTALTAAPNGVDGDGSTIFGLLKNENTFAKVMTGVTLAPNSAYLSNPASAPVRFVIGGEATGISEVKSEECRVKNLNYYNLAGQRVNANAKGIVVVNGKKHLVK